MDTKRRFRGYDFTEADWLALCERHGNRCLRCGEVKPLTVDHILPVVAGGTDGIDNVQPLCRSCNTRKNSRHIDYRTAKNAPDDPPLVRRAWQENQTCNPACFRWRFTELVWEKFSRERRYPTQAVIARESGLPASTIRCAMDGDIGNLPVSVVLRLCRYFGVKSITELVEWVPDEAEQN